MAIKAKAKQVQQGNEAAGAHSPPYLQMRLPTNVVSHFGFWTSLQSMCIACSTAESALYRKFCMCLAVHCLASVSNADQVLDRSEVDSTVAQKRLYGWRALLLPCTTDMHSSS